MTTDDHVFRWETNTDYTTDAARCTCGWFLWSPSREEMISGFDVHKDFVKRDRLKRRAELIETEMNLHELMLNQTKDAGRCRKEGCRWSMCNTSSIAKILNAFESHRATEAERKYH